MSFIPEGNPNTFVDKKTTGSENKSTGWKVFSKHPRAEEIAYELRNIPEHWALTPVRGKKPYRTNWQQEPPIDRESLSNGITQGQESTSKKTGKPYTAYDSGYGVRLGDISGGLLAIDVDGASAETILDMICPDLPKTVSWSSGKEGRRQLVFRIPDKYNKFSDFTRITTRKHWWGGECFECDENELLEFRYNRCQSVLPPSHHPDTGKYYWINSPEDAEVADAPLKILAYILELVRKETKETEETERRKAERAQRLEKKRAERLKNPSLSTAGSLSDILDLDILPKLDTEDIYVRLVPIRSL